MPSVSFIIPTWNRNKSLGRLLESIFSQSRNDYEIIVIDNASADGTDEYLRSLGSKVRVIANNKNLGPSQAKNQGIVASKSDFLWFLDSDSELFDPETMSRGLELIANEDNIGVIGGEMNPDGSGGVIYRINDLYPSHRKITAPSSSKVFRRDCDYIPTCNCIVRKRLVKKWGGFDPDYFITSEDSEMCLAVRSSGYRCVFDSRVTVLHHIDMNSRKGSLYLKYRNLIRFVLVNMPWWLTLYLPVYFVTMAFSPRKALAVIKSKRNLGFAKYISPNMRDFANKGGFNVLIASAIVGVDFATSVTAAFFYTAMNFRHILSVRRNRPNFLSKMND